MNPQKVTGVWKNGKLTLWTDTDFTRNMLNRPAILVDLAKAASVRFGRDTVVNVVTGTPPPPAPPKQPEPEPVAPIAEEAGALDELLSFAQGLDNVTVQ